MPKLSDFEHLITDSDIVRVLERVTGEFVETATDQLEHQKNYDNSGSLDPNRPSTTKIKMEHGGDLRTGIDQKYHLVNPHTYKIKITGGKLKHKGIINLWGEARKHIKTLQLWGEAQGRNYMGWYEEVQWQDIANEITMELTKEIVKKLEKRLL